MYPPNTTRVKARAGRKRVNKRNLEKTVDNVEFESVIESAQPIEPIKISRRHVKRPYDSPFLDLDHRKKNGISLSQNRSKLSPPGTADCKSNNHQRSLDLLLQQIPENPMKSEENATQHPSQEGPGFFNTIPIQVSQNAFFVNKEQIENTLPVDYTNPRCIGTSYMKQRIKAHQRSDIIGMNKYLNDETVLPKIDEKLSTMKSRRSIVK